MNPLVELTAELIEITRNQQAAAVALVQAQGEAATTERRHFRIALAVAIVAAMAAIVAAVAAIMVLHR